MISTVPERDAGESDTGSCVDGNVKLPFSRESSKKSLPMLKESADMVLEQLPLCRIWLELCSNAKLSPGWEAITHGKDLPILQGFYPLLHIRHGAAIPRQQRSRMSCQPV